MDRRRQELARNNGDRNSNLRPRLQKDRPILVFHVDQPSNDFNSLFEVLSSDPDRYSLDDANVFPCAIGRSFYEQVLPIASVDLGGAHMRPCGYDVFLVPFPVISFQLSTGTARAAFEGQAAEDWVTFLSCRASEMRHGARLVVVLPDLPNGMCCK